jgi:hypothetical protein
MSEITIIANAAINTTETPIETVPAIATIAINGFIFVDETKVFKDSDEIWTYVQTILDVQWDVLAFEEVPDGLKITTNIKYIDGWICHPTKDGRFTNGDDIREAVAEYICNTQDIEPCPTRGWGGLDRPGGWGHISRGSRKCPEGYNYGYCY